MQSNQKGFGALQTILLLLIVAIIGGTGVYVYKSQKDTNMSLDNANQNLTKLSESDNQSDQPVDQKEEDAWLLFEASDKAYSVRIPDGWEGVALNDNLFIRDTAKMIYKKGTKAKVEILPDGGWDGASPFSLYFPRQNYDQIVREGVDQGEITTASGLTAHKYKYIETKDPEGIGYSKGDTVYNYYFDAPGKYIQVSHVFAEGGTDESMLVERLIKTIQVK